MTPVPLPALPSVCAPATVFARLESWCRAQEYQGWDPFDGLESRLFQATPLNRWPLARLAWLQFFKRSPVNLRPLAATPRRLNPAALALFSRGYGVSGDLARELALAERLTGLRAEGPDGTGRGWGYPFDWEARAFFVPKNTPNAIVTAYAVKALAEAEARTGFDAAPYIIDAARFVAGALVRRRGAGRFLAYVPGSDAMVHNASLWSAYVLAEGVRHGGDPGWRDIALDAVAYTSAAQTAEGAWPYGEAGHHRFIDSFHTGYNLEALGLCAALLGEDRSREIARGMAFYQTRFFAADGRPRYYHDRDRPVDPTCTAQAIITLLTAPVAGAPGDGREPDRRELAGRALDWTIRRLWLSERGHFAYQDHGLWRNRIPYMRWTQAWMFLGLAIWLSRSEAE